MAKPIPQGFHSVTPCLTFKDSKRALEFYKNALGAEVLEVHPGPNGKGVMHATMQIGDSILMMADEMPGERVYRSAETLGGSPVSLYVYVTNVDSAFKQALQAGASSTMEVADMFWGDRMGSIRDPYGYSWMIATHKQDLNADQIRKGAEEFFAQK